MRWPWRRRHEVDPDEVQRHLEELQRRQPKVNKLGRDLAEIRTKNNFSAMVDRAFHGGTA